MRIDPEKLGPGIEWREHIKSFLNVRENLAMKLAFTNYYSECIKLILSCGGDMYNHGKVMSITPEDYKSFLDDQIKKDPEIKENIIFDYSKLISICNNEDRELKLILDLTKLSPGHKTLLTHPLIKALLMMEWKRIQLLWLMWMVLKVAFMLLFIAIGVGSVGLQQFNCNTTETVNYTLLYDGHDKVKFLMPDLTIIIMRKKSSRSQHKKITN